MRFVMMGTLLATVATGLGAQSNPRERGTGSSAREAAAIDLLKTIHAEGREIDIVPDAWIPGEARPPATRPDAAQEQREAEAIAQRLPAAHVKAVNEAMLCDWGCVARGPRAVLRIFRPVPQQDGSQLVTVQLISPPSARGSYDIANSRIAVRLDRGAWRAEGEGELELEHAIIGAGRKRP
jgi:hypothetical protein